MAEKVTIMVLKVDLQCSKCYKKVKKVLCKYPQIRDQMYDEKANTVTITVVCCSPEKIRDKLCYKGGGSIKSIELKSPAKPKEPEKKPDKPKEAEKKPEKPKEAEKKPEKPKEAAEKKPEKPKEAEKKPEKPKDGEKKPEKPKEAAAEKKPDKPKEAAAAPPQKVAEPAAAAPLPPMAYAVGYTCSEGYYNGYGGGPSYYGGPPQQPFPCYETYGRPVYDSWGGGGGGYYRYGGRTGECFSEENPQGCSIM
ncbi:hypothetical protein ERO13_D10G007900v2 [Gossypium hirsutum]|uniref:Protein PYRICULARIA ORYZAE RESISTANCE 21 n=5 Tax=Gossypium TaxID=3633 RepID=A0A1U8LSC1_GOSHI|nr:protein PYRICULARIA ORYZAE RESISTANCE 21 [Gossypium hirsutum]KAB2007158.1 hypothetical protein ES319_D10G008500v1 [Gossypium barbadense]KAG4123932.1 hypothetical protein ERO13_D10G007900v2 [Gossypium hirsutum]TYH47606.1 hypothetical protein ES332_D10G009400v1 [Gossypium tomentosum]TYI59078.1 hypothetical protein E1A91_D10G008700v1 [Gossypium mustelinum]